MKMSKFSSVLKAIRETLSPRKAAGPLLILGVPTNAHKVPFLDSSPEGLKLLHVAGSVPEAEMLVQVLIEAGFRIEYVSPTTTGVFGMTGNDAIYVAAADYEKAAEFLQEYLNPTTESESQEG